MFRNMIRNNDIIWAKHEPKSVNFRDIKIAIIGGTNGIGRAISHELVLNGAKVTVVGRSFRDLELTDKINFLKADLSTVKECERIGKELKKELDWTHIIFTSGILAKSEREVNDEGIEMDVMVSYLSRYIILKEISTVLSKKFKFELNDDDDVTKEHTNTKKTNETLLKPRVFVMGFPGNQQVGDPDNLNSDKGKYNNINTHMITVAANESLVMKFATDSSNHENFNIYGLNPGIIKTDIRSNVYGSHTWIGKAMEWIISKTSQDTTTYAKHFIPLLMTPDIENHNGICFNNKIDAILPSKCMNMELVNNYIDASDKLIEMAHSSQINNEQK